MDKKDFMDKLRMFLADTNSRIWDDVELNTILDDALKQYSKDSMAFTASFDFCPDQNGVYHYPEDYAGFLIGWNEKSQEIVQSTARELFVRSLLDEDEKGTPEYIFDDTSSFGEFCLYPVPENMQNRQDVYIASDYGEVIDSSFGVFCSNDYGTSLSIQKFDHSGTVFYSRYGTFEEVKDHMAVIFYAMKLAYCSDSDMANSDLANYWDSMYRQRINAFGRVVHNNTGRQVSGNFY